MEFEHIPVLLNETIDGMCVKPDGTYVDCTVGGGGHSKEIAKKLGKDGILIGIDQDEEALEKASLTLKEFGDRIRLVHSNFRRLSEVLDAQGIDAVDGILMDIGVSSHQLDEEERGFSYQGSAPLDMRMDPSADVPTAADIVNHYDADRLTAILWQYGEENWAKRIAEFIIVEREKEPIETTDQLVEVIKKAIPKKVRMEGKHPAKRTFQALRIEVNHELDVLEETLEVAVDHLKPGGRLLVITFHSLEDRIVKNAMKDMAKGCTCPPDFPVCVCGKKPKVRLVTRKPIVASKVELETNRRAHSAKLRIAERIGEVKP